MRGVHGVAVTSCFFHAVAFACCGVQGQFLRNSYSARTTGLAVLCAGGARSRNLRLSCVYRWYYLAPGGVQRVIGDTPYF